MSVQQIGYASKIDPTEAELNLIARLRQLRGLWLVDSDSMTIWQTGKPEHLNGRMTHFANAPLLMDANTSKTAT